MSSNGTASDQMPDMNVFFNANLATSYRGISVIVHGLPSLEPSVTRVQAPAVSPWNGAEWNIYGREPVTECRRFV
jgi:hypothetical protein